MFPDCLSDFLKMKTSTVKGYKKVKQEFYKRVEAKIGEELTEDELSKFWSFYNEIEPSLEAVKYTYKDRQKVVYEIFTESKDSTIEELVNTANNLLFKPEVKKDEMSDFFTIE